MKQSHKTQSDDSAGNASQGTIYGAFREAARGSARSLAIEWMDACWTYAEAASEVNRLIERLSNRGVKCGSPVLVSTQRGAELIFQILALSALEAIIIGVHSEDEAQQLWNSGVAPFWLGESSESSRSEQRLVLREPADYGRRDPELWTDEDGVSSSQIEFVIATSGTTQSPKLVPVSRSAFAALRVAMAERRPMPHESRIALVYHASFDPFFQLLVQAFDSRSCLVLPHGREHLLISKFVNHRSIDVWDSVPGLVQTAARLGYASSGSMGKLKLAVFGGESLSWETASLWREAAPESEMVNAYGPTEMTVTCIEGAVPDSSEMPLSPNGSVPIGTPLSGVRVKLHELQSGVVELCVRGPQRFSGYLDPALNAGRFIDDSGAPVDVASGWVPEDLWFRTGDLVEESHDQVFVTGRRGRVVKVQGGRVDLERVQQVIEAEVGIGNCWVGVHNSELVAVLAGGPFGVGSESWRLLRSYARPRRTLQVDSIPRMHSGKVDVAQLRRMIIPGRDRA